MKKERKINIFYKFAFALFFLMVCINTKAVNVHNLGRVFSAEEIYEHIWNETAYSVENTVMVHIRRIREKIEINPSEPKYLKVVWGIGYKIEKYN